MKVSAAGEQFSPGTQLSPSDLEAYKLYLKGRFQWGLRTEAGLRQAIEYFHEAIGMDPANERAYCGLADCYTLLSLFGFARPKDVMPEAKVAAQRALTLNNALAEAHASLGFIQAVYDWDWKGAGANLKRATSLNPGYATGLDWYAFFLAWTQEPQLARTYMERAWALDPFSQAIGTHLAWLAFWDRDYGRAEALLRRTIALNPKPTASATHALLALTCAQQSRFSEALSVIQDVRRLDPSSSTLPDLARIYALAGQKSNAARTISEAEIAFRDRSSFGVTIAMAYEATGDREKAFAWLDAAHQERASELTFLKVDPRLDGLRSDTRFNVLLKDVNLIG
jgi:tetratricopeptide (TPR) repeat protein